VTFERIVVGTDGSDTAMRAVDHAAGWAGKLGASLIVMHALPKSRGPPGARDRSAASKGGSVH
jgi:nucleotide-binding universal stress UspA family protein